MFIRKTTNTHPKTKKQYFVYQLVESVRTPKGPRQRILLSLGGDLDLSEQDFKLLSNRIEEILNGSYTLLPYPEEIETIAQKCVSELVRQRSKVSEQSPTPELDYQTIDMQSIEPQEPRTIGTEHLLYQMAEQIGLPKKLRELGLSEREAALSLGTIIGRAAFPASERATHEWLLQRSALGELLDFDFQKTSLRSLYQISDTLLSHKKTLEQYLEGTECSLHGYQTTMVLYDLTNVYMEGQAKKNPKAKHGLSKEKRSDCPLVTLGLVINEHGFAARSSFLPGNVSEPSTLQKAIEALSVPEQLIKPTVVLDAGIATEDNLRWLREHQFTYVVSARQNAPSMELEAPLVAVGDPEETQVKAALIKADGTEERWLYCESEAKRATAMQMKKLFQQRFEADLTNLRASLSKKKGRKKYAKVLERIGRLKEKHSRISGCYEITLQTSEDGKVVTDVQWLLAPEKLEDRLNGHYFLRTNLQNTSPEKLWAIYDSIRVVENTFRFLKSSLGARPVHHQKEDRVDGHLWISILAYHLIQNCLYQLKEHGIVYRWETVRNRMSARIRVTMRAQTKEGATIYQRSTTKAEEAQRQIYHALGMTTQILKTRQTLTQ